MPSIYSARKFFSDTGCTLYFFSCVYFSQIHAGLHKLLGKPVSVDADSLTWTLMKCVNSESCDVGCTKNEYLAESNSKLNVALSVMHECFEPLQNPPSSRDLMEDVIFSRWSEILIL